ncbi:MAG: type VI secretion system protein TssA [Rhodobacteraceae bacterium]|nr:type VI secretion system protein TssA [Paracoccaceae bacterium]
MDPAVLLQSKGDDLPSGENLEYDPAFTDMEIAGQPGEESQIGEEIILAEDPDYRDLAEKSLVVLEQSHDIRAAVFLADAITHTQGLTGFADVTTYILGCLTEYWDTCHPELDEDDDNDPTMRINAVQGLGQDSTIIRSLRRTPLTDSRSFGKMSMREIDVAEGRMTAPSDMTAVPDSAAVSAAFQDTEEEFLTGLLTAAQTAEDNIRAISATFDENTPGQGPDLDELIKLLRLIRKKLAENSSAEDVADIAEDGEDQSDAGGAAPAASAGGAIGGINSPSDVSNAIDRIIAYYRRAEPSSPVPIVLERAKRLVGADFLTIMADMAPLGINNVHLIGGIEDDD